MRKALLPLGLVAILAGEANADCLAKAGDLDTVHADRDGVTSCVADACWHLDFASGRYRRVAADDATPTDDVERPADDGVYRVVQKGKQNVFVVTRIDSGRSITIETDGRRKPGPPRCDTASLLDGVILLEQAACAEDGKHHIVFYDPSTGKVIAALGGRRPVETWAASWVRARDHVWAFTTDDGQVVLQDVRTGKLIRQHAARALFRSRPRRRAAPRLAATPSELVVVSSGPDTGAVALIDRRSGRIRQRFAPPACHR